MNIIKPKNDTRIYEYLELENNMKIILICDQDTQVSAAAMSVGVGFYEDFDKYQGIAHFLEHMLFMGTKKYPEVNHFMSFLNKCGGNTNAFTTGESTNYYFDVPSEYLESGLDIFGQFFLNPLFNPETVEKEIDAINAEHSKNYNSDTWRLDRIVREMAFEDHPYYHFGCGTKKTLNKKDIREKLLNFHSNYYSSNIMNLVVYTKLPINKIKKIIKNIFSNVTNKNVVIEKNFNIFKKLPITVKAIPIADKDYLKIYIQLPQNIDDNDSATDPLEDNIYKFQSLQYIYKLLAHEARGTLLYYLKKMDLSNETIVTYDDNDRYLTAVMFSIDLTEHGFKNIELIISMIYNYINLIKTQGITKWQYDEYRKIAKMTFDYEPRTSPSNYVVNIVTEMNRYKTEHILIRNNYYTKFNQKTYEEIQLYLNNLIPYKAINIILSKQFENESNMQKDSWYNIKYKIVDNLQYNSQASKNIKFLLPIPNKLVPKNIKIFQHESLTSCNTNYPNLIVNTTNLRIYFKQDHTFNLPFVLTNIILYNNEIYSNIKHYLSYIIYQDILEEKLSKLSSYADYVNTNFSMNVINNGIFIRINSYSNSLEYLLNKLINSFLRTEVNEKDFITSKKNIKNELQNFIYHPLLDVANAYFAEKISNKYFSTAMLLKNLNKIKYTDVENVKDLTKNNCKCDCLIQGNYLEESALKIPEILKPLISSEDVTIIDPDFVLPISAGQEEVYTRSKFNEADKNSFIGIFFEIGNTKNKYITNWDFKYSKLILMQEIISEAFFHQLRSIEQNGYIVNCKIKNMGSQIVPLYGLLFIIQSIKKSPSFLKTRIKSFIKKFENEIDAMTNEDFEKYKLAVIHHLNKPCDNIYEETNKNIRNIIKDQYFDFDKRISKLVMTLTKEIILKFYKKYLINKETRRIRMLQVLGS